MDLNSYAELAVRLVNSAGTGGRDGDLLANLDGLRALVADRQHLNHGVTRNDLQALRALRAELGAFFASCAAGDGEDAADRLNALLIQHPVHPQLSGHDGQPWHVHYTDSGSVADKYAAGAAMGLAVRLTDLGIERFGSCQAPGCTGVYIDTGAGKTRRYCSELCMNRANLSALCAARRGSAASLT
ncbi:MAG: CGNR zinc finger domain-containing protein [Streptosporangiaceae bacterium]|nr:CGNR zinc finger domain-containing protein [Streptosporangiaceae bacterium]